RLAFNVSLRMFTRSSVIQRRVEDLQLGVESYKKKLNLTRPDTYRSDLKRREAYTAYSNPRGFIYQNKDKKNRLMRIDELHKSSDGTLNDVRNALNDRLKGIRMHESAFAEEPVQTTSHMEEPSHLVFETCADDQPIVQTSQHPEWFSQPRRPPSPDRDWNKTLPTAQGDAQSWISKLARQTDARSSFNELLNTPIDFSNFIMNRLGVATLTPELLAGPTYELMRGSCTPFGEFLTGGENVSSSMGSQLTGNLLSMYTPRGGSSLSPSSRLWNDTTISIWIGFRSIIIQRRVEDLQLGVESYQKRLNLTKPDTYRTDLRRREAYTAYSNPRGFIYQNKDKKNRLMRIDELHKFSDGTLNDVRNALDDRLKGIRMHEIVTHWFTLIVLSALRRSGNENMLGLIILILRSILTDLQVTPTNLDE
nr:hypothetical protein [Tanacetum cinerariifolium]